VLIAAGIGLVVSVGGSRDRAVVCVGGCRDKAVESC
jgi:hypothetical protein